MAEDRAAGEAAAPIAAAAPSPAPRKRPRGFETLGDMARSMGVVLAVVLLIVLITIRVGGQSIRVVDYRATLVQAKIGAPFVLQAPEGLASGWKATSVSFDPPARTGVPGVTVWHVGWVTPDSQYAGLEQTNGLATDAVESALSSTPSTAGSSVVGGVTWQRWVDQSGKRRALSSTQGQVTVVVDGTAGWAELELLAGALRAQP